MDYFHNSLSYGNLTSNSRYWRPIYEKNKSLAENTSEVGIFLKDNHYKLYNYGNRMAKKMIST
jgi:hypothetical protein